MKAMSERLRMMLVAGALMLYVVGVYFMLPHETIAHEVVSAAATASPEPLVTPDVAHVPVLTRDVFARGLDEEAPPPDAASTNDGLPVGTVVHGYVPPPTSLDVGQVPPLETGLAGMAFATTNACRIDVNGTFRGLDPTTHQPVIYAHLQVNGGVSERVSVGSTVCGKPIERIDYDGVFFGGVKYYTQLPSQAAASASAAQAAPASPQPTTSPAAAGVQQSNTPNPGSTP